VGLRSNLDSATAELRDAFPRRLSHLAADDVPTREALRQAWQDPHVDFTSVEVPSAAERREGKDGTFRDPKSQRKVIDFFAYSQVAIVEPWSASRAQ